MSKETANLKAMPREEFDKFAEASIEERRSFGVHIPVHPVQAPKFSAGRGLKQAVKGGRSLN